MTPIPPTLLAWAALIGSGIASALAEKPPAPARLAVPPKAVPPKAVPFTAAQVRLLDGVFKESQDAEAKYLLSLDLDRLLAPYRAAAGLAAKAKAYPGWETENLPGVGLAFYLSGISRLHATTRDAGYGKRIRYILDELEACQEPSAGYLLGTTDGRATLTRVEREGMFPGFSVWHTDGRATPYYSMEKLFSGLRDAWRLCQEPKALPDCRGIGPLPERGCRRANPGQSFAYRMNVPEDQGALLVCTFAGREPYPLKDSLFYRITLDGTELLHERQTIDHGFTTGIYEKLLPVRREWITGKSAVEVAFTADPDGKTASLVELRMVSNP